MGIKLMLLGISVILFGGILVIDPMTNLGGIEFVILFLGLLISCSGFIKNE